jgi:hypothetical protein
MYSADRLFCMSLRLHPPYPSFDTTVMAEAVRITKVYAESRKELHFGFNDNVALFWHVDLKQSYLRRNTFEKLRIAARAGYNADGGTRGIDLFISRAGHAPFASGRYSFHLVLRSAFPDQAQIRTDIQTGVFTVGYGLLPPG